MPKNQACPGVPGVTDLITDHETDLSRRAVDELRRKNQLRQKVLDRLWEIAALPAEVTRGSITGQVKAISMIVAIEGLIPDRRAGSAQTNPVPAPAEPDIYRAEWLRRQQGEIIDPQQDPIDEEANPAEPEPAPGSAEDAPNQLTSLAPGFVSTPDTRVPFSIKKNPFARYR